MILAESLRTLFSLEEETNNKLIRYPSGRSDSLEQVYSPFLMSFYTVQRHQIVIHANFLNLKGDFVASLEKVYELLFDVDRTL
jgi:hypothetical protein